MSSVVVLSESYSVSWTQKGLWIVDVGGLCLDDMLPILLGIPEVTLHEYVSMVKLLLEVANLG